MLHLVYNADEYDTVQLVIYMQLTTSKLWCVNVKVQLMQTTLSAQCPAPGRGPKPFQPISNFSLYCLDIFEEFQ